MRKYLREEKIKEDKKQQVFINGNLCPNTSALVIVEQPKLDFNKKVTCPFCLSWLPVSKFVISTKKGYHKGLGKCPECDQQSRLRTLFGLGKYTPEDYAKFIVEYPAGAFWKKCRFEVWKTRLAVMKWTKEFWDEYRRLNPKLDEATKEEEEEWKAYDASVVEQVAEQEKPVARASLISHEVRREEKFTRLECKSCQYKAGSYCWNQCPYNIWKKKSDW